MTTRLRRLRKAAGLSQAELAARAGTDQGTVSAAERDARGGTVRLLLRFAEALNVEPAELLPTLAELRHGREHRDAFAEIQADRT